MKNYNNTELAKIENNVQYFIDEPIKAKGKLSLWEYNIK